MSDLPPTFVRNFHDEQAVRKMVYQELGQTGLLVSKLSLGGAVFSHLYACNDETEAIRIIQAAIASGINYIDTAPHYGEGVSEQILGKALKGVPREAYYIATKVGRYGVKSPDQFNFTASRTKQSIETSLNYLGLDSVDIIQIHDIEFAANLDIVINETLPAVEEARKEGKTKFIGVTGYPLKLLKEIILKAPGRFDTVLAYARYTLLDDSLLEYLPFFLEQKLGIISASGNGMGLLTNRGPHDWHPAHEDTKERCRLAAEYCKEHGVELGKLAMWYHAQLKGPSTFLSGMGTQEILEINLDSIYNGLNKTEAEALEYCSNNFFLQNTNWE